MPANDELQLADSWRDRLAPAGLDTFDKLIGFRDGVVVSLHKERQTYRIHLADGATVFLKRDVKTACKQILTDWLAGRRSRPLTIRERWAISLMAALGVRTAEVIGWGQRRRLGVASQGVLLTAELPGEPLDRWLGRIADGDLRSAVLTRVGGVLSVMYASGLSWPDLLAKHVFIDGEGQVGLLDLERLIEAPRALRRAMPRQVRRFCGTLSAAGATADELGVLVEAIGREDVPAPAGRSDCD